MSSSQICILVNLLLCSQIYQTVQMDLHSGFKLKHFQHLPLKEMGTDYDDEQIERRSNFQSQHLPVKITKKDYGGEERLDHANFLREREMGIDYVDEKKTDRNILKKLKTKKSIIPPNSSTQVRIDLTIPELESLYSLVDKEV